MSKYFHPNRHPAITELADYIDQLMNTNNISEAAWKRIEAIDEGLRSDYFDARDSFVRIKKYDAMTGEANTYILYGSRVFWLPRYRLWKCCYIADLISDLMELRRPRYTRIVNNAEVVLHPPYNLDDDSLLFLAQTFGSFNECFGRFVEETGIKHHLWEFKRKDHDVITAQQLNNPDLTPEERQRLEQELRNDAIEAERRREERNRSASQKKSLYGKHLMPILDQLHATARDIAANISTCQEIFDATKESNDLLDAKLSQVDSRLGELKLVETRIEAMANQVAVVQSEISELKKDLTTARSTLATIDVTTRQHDPNNDMRSLLIQQTAFLARILDVLSRPITDDTVKPQVEKT